MGFPRTGADELPTGQNAAPQTMNEALRYVEQGASCFIVKDKDLATPPGSPSQGDAYIVPGSPTGAWTGWTGRIAFRMSSSWEDITPIEGAFAYVQDENLLYLYGGAAWAQYDPPVTAELDDLVDVNAPTPSTNDALVWDGSEWVPVPLPGGGGGGGTVPDGGTTGQVLTKASGVDQDTEWGNGPMWALAGTGQTAVGVYDFAVDGAKASIDFADLGGFNELLVVARGLTNATNSTRALRVSVDNGSNFFGTSGDYVIIGGDGQETNTTAIAGHGTNATAARSFIGHILNMKGPVKACDMSFSTTAPQQCLFVASASDIDAVRVLNSGGGNMTAGTVRVFAR